MTEQILDSFAQQQGWGCKSQLDLALRYIENQKDPAAWQDFLAQETEAEELAIDNGTYKPRRSTDTEQEHRLYFAKDNSLRATVRLRGVSRAAADEIAATIVMEPMVMQELDWKPRGVLQKPSWERTETVEVDE